jgi:hypothetical protein
LWGAQSRGSSKGSPGPAIPYHPTPYSRSTSCQPNDRPGISHPQGECTVLFQSPLLPMKHAPVPTLPRRRGRAAAPSCGAAWHSTHAQRGMAKTHSPSHTISVQLQVFVSMVLTRRYCDVSSARRRCLPQTKPRIGIPLCFLVAKRRVTGGWTMNRCSGEVRGVGHGVSKGVVRWPETGWSVGGHL